MGRAEGTCRCRHGREPCTWTDAGLWYAKVGHWQYMRFAPPLRLRPVASAAMSVQLTAEQVGFGPLNGTIQVHVDSLEEVAQTFARIGPEGVCRGGGGRDPRANCAWPNPGSVQRIHRPARIRRSAGGAEATAGRVNRAAGRRGRRGRRRRNWSRAPRVARLPPRQASGR